MARDGLPSNYDQWKTAYPPEYDEPEDERVIAWLEAIAQRVGDAELNDFIETWRTELEGIGE